ncbi:MAG: CRISPR-associated helicase Cas3', partial [bacterium]
MSHKLEDDTFYARTPPEDKPGAPRQTLCNHLIGVSQLACHLAHQARPRDEAFAYQAELAGMLHDLGKYRLQFQAYLRGDRKKGADTAHSIYGAAPAYDANSLPLTLAVLGHHAGLHARRDLKTKIDSRHIATAHSLIEKHSAREKTLQDLVEHVRTFDVGPIDPLQLDLQTRMLFSCLVDADRLDCLRYERGSLPPHIPLDPQTRLQQLEVHVGKLSGEAEVELVNVARADILNACLAASAWPERLLSLPVPTGGGKTLASIAFALNRAILRSDEVRRIIVVIPYLSIIEQNAKTYADVFGRDAVLEHHSGDFQKLRQLNKETYGLRVESEDSSLDPDERDRRLATENWDAPIVVTTSVRFFESLFSNHPSDLRRLHNIARSVVILDEVQTLPKDFLGPLLSMIKGLSEDWCTTFVFCTATQPAFEKPASAGKNDIRWEKGTIRPIIPKDLQSRLFHDLRRVKEPQWPTPENKSSWDELADRITHEKRVLTVVNTKKHALELYRKLLERSKECGLKPYQVHHLSTRMCAQHRLDKIRQIRCVLLRTAAPCWVVSTQLIEAGVDLDFPVVFRAMGPLDSIIQA